MTDSDIRQGIHRSQTTYSDIRQSRGAEKGAPWHPKMVKIWGVLGAKAPQTPQIGAPPSPLERSAPWKFSFLGP